MTLSCLNQSRLILPVLLLLFFWQNATAQCPTLSPNATLTSADCAPGLIPCTLCPGDTFNLTGGGTGFQPAPGTCVNWFYGTTNTFNPYNGEGTLLGCSPVFSQAPTPCSPCPTFVGIFADACGTEENNEFLVLLSGGGFTVNGLSINFDAANNGNPENADINSGGCGFQIPSAGLISLIQNDCPNSSVIPLGPGESAPPNVPVLVFTSSNANFDYDFSSLCGNFGIVYVLQSGCARSIGAFSNSSSIGPRTTQISLPCGCSSVLTYDCMSLVGGDGAFVVNTPVGPTYGNVGCVFPNFPLGNGAPAIPPFDAVVTAAMCNNGPYFVVGIYEPLPQGCGQIFTNYLEFNVLCAVPTLGVANVCNNVANFDLTPLEDPAVPGDWSGPGVNGDLLDATGLSGSVDLTFTPTTTCNTIATTTITILDAPTAIIQTGSSSICAGQSEFLQVELNGTGPFTFVYAENGIAQTPVTTPDPVYDLTVSPGSGVNIYTLLSVTANGCTGMVSGADTVTVVSPPTATLSGTSTICGSGTATLTLDFTGQAPFMVDYTADGVLQTTLTATSNPFTFTVSPTANTTYDLTGVSSSGCLGSFFGQAVITVAPGISATLSGGGQICQAGSGTDLTVNFTGTGPFTFVYAANSVLQTPVTTNSNPYVFNVNPNIGTFYTMDSVSNGVCSGMVSGQAIVFVFTPPTANITGTQTFCDSASTNVMIDFTGTGPFTITYSINSVLQPPVMTIDDPFLIPVNTNISQTYILTEVLSPGCTGMPTGSAVITVNYPPGFDSLKFTCNPVLMEYVVEFDVTNATLPLSLVSGSGNFTGTHFVSNPIPQNLGYNFVFNDANNCGDVTVSGIAACNCQTESGSLLPDSLVLCVGDIASAIHDNLFVNDGNDLLRFILHTSPSAPPGTILAWNTTPQFSFGAGMLTGVTYYISAIAGNPDGSGNIDLNDPCLSISAGIPVIFYATPLAILGADATICAGAQAIIPIVLSGTAPYILNWTVNGVPQSIGSIPGPGFQLALQALSTTTVILTNISDSHCSTPLADTAIVTVHVAPQIQNFMYTCDLAAGTYTIEFDALGQSPNTVSGVAGSFTGFHFTSVPIPAGTAYTVTLMDANNCGQDSESGTPFCACVTNSGMLTQAPLTLCVSDTAIIGSAFGFVLEPGDTLLYGLLNAQFNYVAFNDTPSFGFDPATMMTDSTYHIVVLAGNSIAAGVDLNDPCLSVFVGPTIVWRTPPTAILSGLATVCPGGPANLNIQFTGDAPFMFTYTANGLPFTIPPTAFNPYSLPVTPIVTTNYSLVSVSSAGACPGSVSGNATVNVNAPPQILNLQTDCDFAANTVVLQFDVGNGAVPNQTYTVSGITGAFNDTTFTSIPLPAAQAYSIVVTNPTGCSATLSGVTDCQCQTDAGTLNTQPLHACLPDGVVSATYNNDSNLDPDDTLQFILCQNPALLPAGIFASGSEPDFGFQTGMVAGNTYFIVVVAGNQLANGAVDWTDPCLSVSPPVPLTFHELPTATISGDTAICKGKSYSFKIKFQGEAPFTFGYAINGIAQTPITAPQGSFNIATNNVQQQQVFTLLSIQDAFCDGTVSGVVTVDVLPDPGAALLIDQTICAGNSATLTLQLNGADSFNLVLTGGPMPIQLNGVTNGATVTVSPGATTTYTLGNVMPVGNTCPVVLGPPVTITVTELTASSVVSNFNGFNLSCADANDGAITLNPSGGTPPITASWSNGANSLSLNNLGPGAYAVELTDQLGCEFTDAFNLTAPPPLQFTLSTQSPACFGDDNGAIILESLSGGTGPFTGSLNGMPIQTIDVLPLTLDQLADGSYTVEITDINGCATEQEALIDTPQQLTVDLGPDITIFFGDSTLLTGLISTPVLDTFYWSPLTALSTPDALSTFVVPERTQTYTLSIVDAFGCTTSDAVQVIVKKGKRIYLPNVIHPGSNLSNDYFTVYAGPELRIVRSMRIFDRWGELLFENKDFFANQPNVGWDGRYKNKEVSTGVYVYVVELEYINGITETIGGDVTVMR